MKIPASTRTYPPTESRLILCKSSLLYFITLQKCHESAQVVKQIASGFSIHTSHPKKEPKVTIPECLPFPWATEAPHCAFFCSFRALPALGALS